MFNTKENHKSLSAATKEEGDSSPSLREFPALLECADSQGKKRPSK
ncbi:hypothetical protein VIS19158_20866 [Vibrio scophthalmi LMG 19158]|uniref:Uncharacterized protein n=1 Tax=Vibrio scophthalmi LMG 19158 TaxID=870967 RepID=F9RVP0_9VIBR|nr:hypothetical protein VIS19158_20866 [Vibrio scophthalmi LMG 19158]